MDRAGVQAFFCFLRPVEFVFTFNSQHMHAFTTQLTAVTKPYTPRTVLEAPCYTLTAESQLWQLYSGFPHVFFLCIHKECKKRITKQLHSLLQSLLNNCTVGCRSSF